MQGGGTAHGRDSVIAPGDVIGAARGAGFGEQRGGFGFAGCFFRIAGNKKRYANLAWLSERQEAIEEHLFTHRRASEKPSLYLYVVTSTYLEGQHNALAAFGFNRDGKRGKKQIVIGLLCDEHGVPVALEAFPGNTADPKTVSAQIAKLRQRFNAHNITLVGDRGMLRGPQLKELSDAGLHYITATTDPPDTESAPRMERFILRRNPVRRDEIAANRTSKVQSLEQSASELNTYLAAHPRAKVSTAVRRLEQRLKSLGLSHWMSVHSQERTLTLSQDAEALEEESKLDGCYVLRTDLSVEQASKETVHEKSYRLERELPLESELRVASQGLRVIISRTCVFPAVHPLGEP